MSYEYPCEVDEPIALKCPKCGRFVKMDILREETYEDWGLDLDGNDYLFGIQIVRYYECKKCGEIREPYPVFI